MRLSIIVQFVEKLWKGWRGKIAVDSPRVVSFESSAMGIPMTSQCFSGNWDAIVAGVLSQRFTFSFAARDPGQAPTTRDWLPSGTI